MATREFVVFLVSCFSLAVLSVLFFHDPYDQNRQRNLLHSSNSNVLDSRSDKVWPELKFSWKLVVATVVGFLGSACGTVGGVGGGGIFVPMLNLVVGFDAKSAAAISKCMIMGATTSSVWYNIRVPHPTKEVPILDYDLALLFQPMLMMGISIGVSLSVVFPYWLITVLIIILFISTSSRSFYKGIKMWKEETILKHELETEAAIAISRDQVVLDADYELLVSKEEKSTMQIISSNLRWKGISVLLAVWFGFLLVQIFKNDVATCSVWYWVLFVLQFPIAFVVCGYEAVKLCKEPKMRMSAGNKETICEASINWTPMNITFCALCGILGGTVGGLLGSGGGFILGPLLLEIGVIPQVASATATFVMMFSSSLSVVEFYLLGRFPIPCALYLMAVSVLAGFFGQFVVRKIVKILGRASIIVFILSGVIVVSALIMGIVGVETSISMIQNHEFMGFLNFCSSG